MESQLEIAIRKDAGKLLDRAFVAAQIEAWVDGRTSVVELHEHTRSVVCVAVARGIPKPDRAFEPRDNSPAGWAIGVGIFIIVCGTATVAQGVGGAWPFVAIIAGLFLAVRGFRNWTSEEAYRQSIQEAKKRITESWQQQQVDVMSSTCERLYYQLHVVLGRRAGVPERLVPDFAEESIAHAEQTRHQWRVDWWASQPTYPTAPKAQPQRLSHEAYEEYCARWLRSIGWEDAKVTRYSQDGGVDVVTSMHVVQCKHYDGGYIGAPAVREIFGVATAEAKKAVVITSGRFTTQASAFAEQAEVALIHLDELVGDARSLNRAGRNLIDGPEHLGHYPVP